MSIAKKRTSFALDEETLTLVQSLAAQWQVSQAEVVRRAVRVAADRDHADTEGILARLAAYRSAGRLTAEQADAYLGTVAEGRAAWERGDS